MMLLMMAVGVPEALGQTDYSGTYYLSGNNQGTDSYNVNNTTTNYYLCPTENWISYISTNNWTAGDDQPFLTTYQYRNGTYDHTKAVWIIEKHPTLNYYYIRYAKDGKYLTFNGKIGNSSSENRVRVHLEATNSPNDNMLFEITKPSPYYDISPKNKSGWYLNITQGNKNSLQGQKGKNDGPEYTLNGTTNRWIDGTIGIWNKGDDYTSKWYLEKAEYQPEITDNHDGTVTITSETGATIYYTIDGTTPTTSTITSGTSPVTVSTLTESSEMVKAIAKSSSYTLPSSVTTYNLPQCYTPVITVSNGTVTITCATPGATIRYTVDDTEATLSSPNTYTTPFSIGNASVIRAIASKVGYSKSEEAYYLDFKTVHSSSEITSMRGMYRLASDFTSSSAIGTDENPFRGTIDGQMNTISGLDHPLVAYANGATIKNITIASGDISGNGAIVEVAKGNTRIYNCGYMGGTITGTSGSSVGGLVGELHDKSRVINCFSFANVSGGSIRGGIVGNNMNTTNSASIDNINTMVMNCMFYGDIPSGGAPVYNGTIIDNNAANNGLNNFNYFSYEDFTGTISPYNCALGAEKRYLQRFEFHRNILNSNRELAAWYATGNPSDGKGVGSACEMAKWVLDKSIAPYPILKPQDYYPSVINYEDAPSLGAITISISQGSGCPTGATVNNSKELTIYDKSIENHHYNYRTIRLPYYCEVGGTLNYTKNKVVTGWDVTVTGGSANFTDAADSKNFANRDANAYSRVFSQGAYLDLPEGENVAVSITAHWANCVYLSDPTYDVTYNTSYAATNVAVMPHYTNGDSYSINDDDQVVYTSFTNAIGALSAGSGTVYDHAIVLVGNYHQFCGGNSLVNNAKLFTVMSADLNSDCEPDYSFFYQHTQRTRISPVRFDFLNFPGIGIGQKVNGTQNMAAQGIFRPNGWFEITNTCLVHFTQFEHDFSGKTADSPVILLGGIYDQFVSGNGGTNNDGPYNHTSYIHLGSNVYFEEFSNGVHGDAAFATTRVPISVTGGEYKRFYLSGMFNPEAALDDTDKDAEGYIDGGYFPEEVAGAGQELIDGNVTWNIINADITNFYGGGINDAKSITGDITVNIKKSRVDLYCGGPKFGNMSLGKDVTTTANDCTFEKYFGAGYGGTSYYRYRTQNDYKKSDYSWSTWASEYERAYVAARHGISTSYEYEYTDRSGASDNTRVGRFYINYASLSLAETQDVSSTLTGCTIKSDFFGGGNLGKVNGNVESQLTNCTVYGSVFGAGFSATIPTVDVWPTTGFVSVPSYNGDAGVYVDGNYPDTEAEGMVVYTWSDKGSTSSPFTDDADGNWIYTNQDLTSLGQVIGNATLTIDGDTYIQGIIHGKLNNSGVLVVDNDKDDSSSEGGVFGGGDASGVIGNTEVNIMASGLRQLDATTTAEYNTFNVFGGGNKADVGGNVVVNMTNGVVSHDIYGGGALANTNINNASNYGTANESISSTSTNTTQVNLDGGTVNGDVYGGGLGDSNNAALVYGDVLVTVNGTKMVTGYTSGQNPVLNAGRVFGANNVNGTPKGHVKVLVQKTAAVDNQAIDVAAVFGGGNQAAYEPIAAADYAEVEINMTSGEGSRLIVGNVYGGGNMAGIGNTTTAAGTEVNIVAGDVKTGVYGGCNSSGTVSGNIAVNINGGTIGTSSSSPADGVFGGGYGASTATSGNVTLTVGNRAGTYTPTIYADVYGGSALGSVNDAAADLTTINILSGTIHGDIYGGGLGEAGNDNIAKGQVNGAVTVNIGAVETTTTGEGENAVPTTNYFGSATIDGSVFGCNNTNGSPKDDVTVNVYKTAHTENVNTYPSDIDTLEELQTEVADYDAIDYPSKFAIVAVYGGGNKAAYNPETVSSGDPHSTTVHVYGCSENTIQTVYGGGNAADATDVNVIIDGGFIDRVFGGGNGYSSTGNHDNPNQANYNPGADITGSATTQIHGGLFRQVFGGSNQYGNVNSTVLTIDNNSGCTELINESFGGANEAVITGTVATTLDCSDNKIGTFYGGSNMANINGNVILTVKGGEYINVFGGSKGVADNPATVNVNEARAADITGSVTLNLYGGTMTNAFGGSDANGNITGKITVNVLDYQSGTCALDVENIYGAGNWTAYTPTNQQNSPEVNVIHIGIIADDPTTAGVDESKPGIRGNVYGGGKGDANHNALVTANPVVNIGYDDSMENLIPSDYFTSNTTISSTDDFTAVVVGNVYGGGDLAEVAGSTTVNLQKANSSVSSLFGGGNQASVGNAVVNVTGGSVSAGVYGGCNTSGSVGGTINETAFNGTIAVNISSDLGESGTPLTEGIYGGGKGSATETNGNVTVTIGGASLDPTIYADVYGGSALGSVNSSTSNTTTVTLTTGTINGNIYGGGMGQLASTNPVLQAIAAEVKGAVQVNINGGSVVGGTTGPGVYGGCNYNGTVDGAIAVNINGGTVGTSNTARANVHGGGYGQLTTTGNSVAVTIGPSGEGSGPTVYGDVYGGSALGSINSNSETPAVNSECTTQVTMNKGTVYGDIYGGGLGSASVPAYVYSPVTVTVYGGSVSSYTVGEGQSAETYGGNVFGCNNLNGAPQSTVTVNIEQTASTMSVTDVYGGGNQAAYTYTTDNYPVVNIKNGTVSGNVFGGGLGSTAEVTGNPIVTIGDTNASHYAVVTGNVYGGGDAAAVTGNTTVTYNDNNASSTVDQLFGGGNAANVSGTSTVTLTSGTVTGGVYGGCNTSGSVGAVTIALNGGTVGAAAVGISGEEGYIAEQRADVFGGGYGAGTSTTGNIGVSLNGTTVYGDIYGGSALGSVNSAVTDETIVNILSGTIHGNIYGGGQGEEGTANVDKGQVNGAVIVNIGSGTVNQTTGFATATTGTATIDGSVYGCNNTNGSPKGNVNVNIYKTAHTESATGYAIANVFGGGNQASYSPTANTSRATVHVYSCDNTIEDLFGGGDAAAAYGVVTIVDGGRFNRVFGGGNGEVTAANIGAGGTNLQIHGGSINQLFGGSNERGTISGPMVVGVDAAGDCSSAMYIDEFFCGNNLASIGTAQSPVDINSIIGCGTHFGSVYGGCNQADIFGNVTLTVVGGEMTNVFGGSKGTTPPENPTPQQADEAAADIHGNVTLNIYGGTIENAFGGSNINGNITGTITVNLLKLNGGACGNNFSVNNIYGGGLNAAYTPSGGSDLISPVVNIIHGTVSKKAETSGNTTTYTGGNVFGGGKGSGAVVTANPKVNVGYDATTMSGCIPASNSLPTGYTLPTTSYSAIISGDVFGGGDAAQVSGFTNVTVNNGTISQSVFGGGNDADVTVNTSVNIIDGQINGNVYGGGNKGDVGKHTQIPNDNIGNYNWIGKNGNPNTPNTNTSTNTNNNTGVCTVTIEGGTIGVNNSANPDEQGNVFGGGKGDDDTFWCEKGMVYSTNVNISNGTVYGNVFGGGEIGRVEDDSKVTIGPDSGNDEPDIKGNVFGAGKGLKTHGYSALVRGNPIVIVQGNAKVRQNVYGGGKIASVGKHKVKTLANVDDPETPPDLPMGMPFTLENTNLGKCTVTIQGSAEISGNVFGAGQGIVPTYDNSNKPGRMGMNGPETFDTLDEYLVFVHTLALTTDTHVTIDGATVYGSVYGGSENGFVQYDTNVLIQGSCEIGTVTGSTVTGGDIYGGGLGLATFADAGRVKGNTSLNINGGTTHGSVYGGGSLGNVEGNTEVNVYAQKVNNAYVAVTRGSETVTIAGNVYGGGKGDDDTFTCEKAMVGIDGEGLTNNIGGTTVRIGNGTVNGNVYGGGKVGRVEKNTVVTIGFGEGGNNSSNPYIKGDVFGAGAGVNTHGFSALVRGNSTVTVEGDAQIGKNVYGGGQIATVGRYIVIDSRPTKPAGGGLCTVNIQGHAIIGKDADENIKGDVFGAGKGVIPYEGYTSSETPWSMLSDNTHNVYTSDKKEDYFKFIQTLALVSDTEVTIDANASVKGSVYGGSENGFVQRYTSVTIQGSCEIGTTTTTTSGTTDQDGNIYGGGRGNDSVEDYAEAGKVKGNTNVAINGGTMHGSVYGGGEKGYTIGSANVNMIAGTVNHNVFGGGALADTNTGNGTDCVQVPGITTGDPVTGLFENTYILTTDATAVANKTYYSKSGNNYVVVTDELTPGESSVAGLYEWSETVYAESSGTAVAGKTYYTKTHPTNVNLLGGIIHGDAYGGGLGSSTVEALVYGDVKVNLNGMTVGDRNAAPTSIQAVLSSTAINGNGNEVSTDADEDYYVVRTLDSNNEAVKGCIVNRVFGCNDLNGSPKSNVTVHVFATQNALKTTIGDKFISDNIDLDKGEKESDAGYLTRLKDILGKKIVLAQALSITAISTYQSTYNSTSASASQVKTAIEGITEVINGKTSEQIHAVKYDMKAVYGGGNEAPYKPTTPNTSTTSTPNGSRVRVIIEGCDFTSIETVYGGGNAAPVPESNVTIVSDYEIETVFGGGNGKDNKESDNSVNEGADIGTLDQGASYLDENGNRYGTGNSNTLITGGYIHEAYGGSNERGTIMGTVNLKSDADGICPMVIGKMVSAGKNADIMGDAITILGCMPDSWVDEFYGGADDANVHGNVELTITSGNFRKVFGGNNKGGIIMGHIKVNIEETGCIPINIDELYLGGNNAAYSYFGYYVVPETDDNGNIVMEDGKPKPLLTDGRLTFEPRVSATDTHKAVKKMFRGTNYEEYSGTGDDTFSHYDEHPELNIISCTHIGQVFGGGYGTGATMYADPTVNINMIQGNNHSNITQSDDNPNQLGEIGDVFGGGNAADVIGDPTVNIGTVENVQLHQSYNATNGYSMSGNQPVLGAYITGSVYGGGKGEADNFFCDKAMIGKNGDGINNPDGGTTVNIYKGIVIGNVYGGGKVGRVEKNTEVTIGHGDGGSESGSPIIKGNVFGGGAGVNTHGYSALVRGNPTVLIEGDAKVLGSVYGGGEIASVARYDVSGGAPVALAQINGHYSGYCTVTVQGYAEIGPDGMKMYHSEITDGTDKPDDFGHVFAAGKGILPKVYDYTVPTSTDYHSTTYEIKEHMPRRMVLYKDKKSSYWEYVDQNFIEPANATASDLANQNVWEYFSSEEAYFDFIETLALSTQTELTIGGHAFVKGSAYGGSENGTVQFNTNVTIQGNCQIGQGKEITTRYEDYTGGSLFGLTTPPIKSGSGPTAVYYDLECASWDYGKVEGSNTIYAPYDPNANATAPLDKYPAVGTATAKSTEGGRRIASDGHTYYGNVFGGGSGSVPYFDTRKGISRYIMTAGQVKGDATVTINSGHILTNVYGGCEATNVLGKATVRMTGGTIGVPRTLAQIDAHPVTCYLFGAGKGDQRVFFNKDTNVEDVEVEITGGKIFGSVFGGGEDGHVLRDVTVTIGAAGVNGASPSGPSIGNWGTSYVDGNVFGGGRGFGGDAYTAGNIAGSVKMEIKGGNILGSIYGGGRLGSVGYGLFDAETNGVTTPGYGEMRKDTDIETGFSTDGFFTNGRGHIDITISGGTIGNTLEYIVPNATNMAEAGIPENDRDISKWNDDNKYWDTWKEYYNISKTEFDPITGQLTHTKGGNVFAGGMGRFYKLDGNTYITDIDWRKLGCVKSTKLSITGGTIRSNVYGGGELGQVVGYHTVKDAQGNIVYTDANNTIAEVTGTEITIQGSNTTIGSEVKDGETVKYTFGSVFGGGYGSLMDEIPGTTSKPKFDAGLVKEDTKIDMQNGEVKASIYGGGEMASVEGSTNVAVSDGTVGIAPITISNTKRYFGGAKMGNVYGGGSGHGNTVRSGKIFKNTNVSISGGTIYHNVYGGGAYGTVGDFDYTEDPNENNKVVGVKGLKTSGTGVATVTITGGTIGTDGKENGMVFGSSRGDINVPGKRDDHTAWVYDANVTIGTYGQGTTLTTPLIKGSVYGSGENGHTFNNTDVKIYSGTIGITSGEGADYPYRGNVYGGGCGTDKYYSDPALITGSHTYNDGEGNKYNPLAGIVYGNTNITITGGHIVRNVYGAGAMGSVGHITSSTKNESVDNGFGLSWPYQFIYAEDATSTEQNTVYTGKTTIDISGDARIGCGGTDDGNVFGAARGSADVGEYDITEQRYEEALLANVRETEVKVRYDTTPTNLSVASSTGTGACITGSVFGGGEDGHVYENAKIEITGGLIGHSVYGGGKGKGTYPGKLKEITGNHAEYETDVASWIAGKIYGNTWVKMTGGHVIRNVYGGGNLGSVGKGNYAGGAGDYYPAGYGEKITTALSENTDFMGSGKAKVEILGGTVGTADGEEAGLATGNVFGSSRGRTAADVGALSPRYEYAPDFFLGYCNETEVIIGTEATGTVGGTDYVAASGPTIYGSVYGGGRDGHVRRETKVTINEGTIGVPYTATTALDLASTSTQWRDRGNVYGSGSGLGTYETKVLKSGAAGTSATDYFTFTRHGTSSGSVTDFTTVDIKGGTIYQNVYGGGALSSVGPPRLPPTRTDDPEKTQTLCKVTIEGGQIGTENGWTQGYGGSVYGASRGGGLYTFSSTEVPEVSVPAAESADSYATTCYTEVNMNGGTVWGDVYGGGEAGIVKHDTDVNLMGGVIKHDAYGGGRGTSGTAAIAANVGNVTVDLNGTTTGSQSGGYTGTPIGGVDSNENTAKGCVVGRVFGCNNVNGTPKGSVLVYVHATQRVGAANVAAKTAATKNSNGEYDFKSFDVEAVYGGGNLAAYEPTKAITGSAAEKEEAKTVVIIDGCYLTSIGQVYGGGNAASVSATDVTVNGAKEIGEVFGGGNGKDDVSYDSGVTIKPNPGANVGYRNYSEHYQDGTVWKVRDMAAYDTKEEREAATDPETGIVYGTGKTQVTIYGGNVHAVYGGSNTKGNVRVASVALLDGETNQSCDFNVDEAYGGGKNADMDGTATLIMNCIQGMKEVYGGAEDADVLDNVELNITNGTFDQVFGGNNKGGRVAGSITVNIEETGCQPVIIGELYGGGNLAGYSIYGYKQVNGDWEPRTSANDEGTGPNTPYASPVINVKSFTGIGNVFGGGYGQGAVMIADPTVNINVVKGRFSDKTSAERFTVKGYVLEADPNNSGKKRYSKTIGGNTVYVPEHEVDAIGAIYNVFGGGNAAEVIGTPHVNIGTLTGEVISLVSKPIEDSEGKMPSQDGWTPSYEIRTVEGVDIRGNVFGGGNEAAVTGDTKVVIGKKDAVKTYSFTSYSAVTGGTEYSTGLAQTTGEVKKVSGTEYAEVVILTNGSYGDYVGKKYYVNKNAKDDGNERAQLMVESESGESLTSTPLYVTIKPFEQKKTYSFTSYGAASEGTQYSTGTAAPTGNFKTFSSTEYMQIVVLTNPDFPEWVGKTFYVPANASTGGTTRTQLYKADGTGAGVWVTITE